jgi:dihydroflavonol-4-reductase
VRILVTGADGLLGSNLVRELLAQGHQVRALIQPGSRSPTLDGLDLERVNGDLLDQGDGLRGALLGCEAVYHCAAVTNQWADAGLTWKVNYEATARLAEACQEAGVSRLIYVGSASSFQFGPRERPGDESGPFPPAYRGVAYMESKHKAAELVREKVRQGRLDAVIVAPTFLLGPYDFGPSSGELIRQFVVRKLRFVSPGGRNFVYAGDAAKAMAAALTRGRPGETYLLAGENLTYLEFFTLVARESGLAPPFLVLPGPAVLAGGLAGSFYEKATGRRGLINYRLARMSLLGTYYTAGKAVRELGMPQTPAGEAIAVAVRGLREYGHI